MFKRLTATLMVTAFLVGALGVLGGCNTVAGAGKDIEKGGKAIKDEANEKR
jgi:predicted small secreted protein